MSLNSMVNKLVRAAAGISASISDNDLDAHVAKLLADEAKAKEMKWSELGLTGLLGTGLNRGDSPDPTLPKTNKRFLASVIRTVDGHNTALLRQQAQSAREIREEKLGESSRGGIGSGRNRGTAASRMFGGALRDVGRERQGDRARDRERNGSGGRKGKERERDREIRRGSSDRRYNDEYGSSTSYREDDRRTSRPDEDRRHRSSWNDGAHDEALSRRSRHEEDDRSERSQYDSNDNGRRRSKRAENSEGRDTSSSKRRDHRDDRDKFSHIGPDGKSRNDRESSRSRLNDYDEGKRSRYDTHEELDNRHKSPKHPESEEHPSPGRPNDHLRPHPNRPREAQVASNRIPSPSPPASPPPPPSSKMDKYFAQSYDPRLDLPAVPSYGLVQEVGWDNMLAVLKEKGKKRRHQSPTLSDTDPLAPPPGVLPSKRSLHSATTSTSNLDEIRKLEKAERRERKERKERMREERKHRRRHRSASSDSESEDEDERERRREKRKKREKDKEIEREERKRAEMYRGLKVEGGAVSGGSGVLEGYDYVRKGGTREWDVGK